MIPLLNLRSFKQRGETIASQLLTTRVETCSPLLKKSDLTCYDNLNLDMIQQLVKSCYRYEMLRLGLKHIRLGQSSYVAHRDEDIAELLRATRPGADIGHGMNDLSDVDSETVVQ
ncbi:hypothetical protein EDD11_005172 [Mortierella claussenii]|nr:hypothetical protein EDD11_005172 [Mortierella claussenii]